MTALEDPRWLALSKERRDALLEKHRDTNVGWYFEWYDSVYEMFVGDCVEKGICVDTHDVKTMGGKTVTKPSIYFSGFSSQGDGACFDGRVNDWPKFLASCGRADLVPLHEKLDPSLVLNWSHSGHYYHSGCASFRSGLYVSNPYDENDDVLQYATWDAITESGDIFNALEDDFIKYVRGLMDGLYKSLEEEHDYRTSDEAIAEHILDYCEEELVEEDDEECSLEH